MSEATQNVETKKPGRPVVEGSKRQQKIADRAAKGDTVKRGRPTNPESKNAIKKAQKEAKVAAGIEVKPGRPKVEKPEVAAEATA